METRTRRVVLVLAAALAAALIGSGCSGGAAAPPEPVVPVGTYQLAAIDNAALPALLVQVEGVSTFVAAGTFSVTRDDVARLSRTFYSVITTLDPPRTTTPTPGFSTPGSLVREASGVVWRPFDAPGLPAAVPVTHDGGTVRLVIDGRTYRFTRL